MSTFANAYRGPTRIRPMSDKRKAQQSAREACCRAVKKRANYQCEARIEGVCQGRNPMPLDVHELLSRAQGGDPTDPDVCCACCRPCHDFLHRNPAEAARLHLLHSKKDHGQH